MLHLHHSNKLENLTTSLIELMHTEQGSVLQPVNIMVQNPGMKRWLQQQISKQQGIAANLEFPLPSRFIWDIFQSQFPDIALQSNYDSEVLRWRIMSVLEAHQDNKALAILKPYLQADKNGLARLQLAEKLASLYDQYLVYRPAMIEKWEQSDYIESESESWQAELWKLLRQQTTEPHRAQLIYRLVSLIQAGNLNTENIPKSIYVLAISAMSPLYKNVLSEISKIIEVHFFILNPCRHYWGDLQSIKQQSKSNTEDLYVENELLASLGQQGRDFIDAFYDENYPFSDLDHFAEITEVNQLSILQSSILNLSKNETKLQNSTDTSIQIVSCYSELRELQVLHENILDLLSNDETLQASDIVVMSPDINTLAPYINAVFGQQPENRMIPYSISDQNDLSASPLIQAVLEWLKLSNSRFTVNEIIAYLELPALQRAYDLNDEDVQTIRYWVKSNHIHWGLNKTHKQLLGLGDNDLNSWIFGIQRMLTAYVMPDGVNLFQQHKTSDCLLSQSDIILLGKLHRFLEDLERWSIKLKQPVSLLQWQQNINALIDTFLLPDDDEEWLLNPLRDVISSWQTQSQRADFNQQLEASLVYYLLNSALTQGSSHHYYLSGGINFCNLIPMRTIPFPVVCLLGMSNDRFPASDVLPQFDLIARYPQKGDRSRREDDRYMFLQSILSAQQKLYISYVGQSQRDDAKIEPSVMVTELLNHIEQTTGQRLNIQPTSLQAFSEQNFKQGSYADQWRIPDRDNSKNSFNETLKNKSSSEQTINKINLQELINFYNNPAKYYMETRLNMSLQEYAESLQDDEAFTLDALDRYKVNQNMMQDWAKESMINDAEYLFSGELSQETLGQLQLKDHLEATQKLFGYIKSDDGYSGEYQFEQSVMIQDVELSAQITSYSASGLLQFNTSVLKGKHQFRYWLQHCFLCANGAIKFTHIYEKQKPFGFTILSEQQAHEILFTLIQNYLSGCEQILPFYVQSAFNYEKDKMDDKKGEVIALDNLNTFWFGENFYPDREVTDVYTKTSLKQGHSQNNKLPAQFFKLSDQMMLPMLQHSEY